MVFGYRCRFYPSCSHYAGEAVERYGLFVGGYLAFKRLIKCNQYFPGGFDPVPNNNVSSAYANVSRETFTPADRRETVRG